MTSKEKAEDLWLSYYQLLPDGIYSDYAAKIESKKFALIAVNEIIEQWLLIDTYVGNGQGLLNPNLKYWQEVKQEIEKI